MEIFDVIDEKDEVIGQATREECHTNPKLIHRAVHFTLVDKKNGKILLTQRSFQKETDPGKLCFLGEHVLAGETWDEAASRGVREELGINNITIHKKAQNLFHYTNQTELVQFYLGEWDESTLSFDKGEIIQLIWKTRDELIQDKEDYSEMTKYWVENIKW